MAIKLVSIKPEDNRYRFYNIHVKKQKHNTNNQFELFEKYVLTKHYGRIGTKGKKKIEEYQSKEEAKKELKRILRLRKRHNYEDIQHALGWVLGLKKKEAKKLSN